MLELKKPYKTADKNSSNISHFTEKSVFVREDDQDWGSSGMNNIEQEPDLR